MHLSLTGKVKFDHSYLHFQYVNSGCKSEHDACNVLVNTIKYSIPFTIRFTDSY